jgi:H+-translocating NAD(P) transhydrogenase
MILGVLKEEEGEQRVALTPDAVSGLLKTGFQQVLIEKGAGSAAFFDDKSFEEQGANLAPAAQIHEEFLSSEKGKSWSPNSTPWQMPIW